ncbi:diguanylate cyclase [Desulfosporosinus sp. HMP52]|uniref:diguanylate cyclase domain-containing protein n=1 Tax=Desulfosporosinus sp. HMP52 TaxID=1487923 RepID=UPI0006911828|nr:diguanylate cyclase [Desulfosporosinus sp. HMP52]
MKEKLVMKKIGMDKKSILFRMTSFVIALIVIQAILLTGTLIAGGVLSQAQENAYQSFYDKVHNRNDSVQREMKNRWTNMTPFINKFSRNLSDTSSSKAFFDESIDELINMLRTTQTTGAFIILKEEELAKYPALYIRDYDPLWNDYSSKDLYLILGPSDLAKKQKIPMDQSWKYDMKFDESNSEFFEKPFSKAPLTFNANLLGYWSPPFKLFPDDLPIITYTMPLFDGDNVLRGIIGVEISVNYFNQFLPAIDLQPRDSMGYLIGYSNEGANKIQPILMVGALQKRMIRGDESFALTEVDKNRNIYRVENHNSEEKIYACLERIGLYKFNTPFEEESWYLVGLMTENHLLNYVRKIQQILGMSLLASIAIGIVGGYFISYRFTKPITQLVKQVKESANNKALKLNPTGLTEIDGLSSAMENANNELLESTVKMSKIIDLADFPIGVFEIKRDSSHVFMTDQLPVILEIDSALMAEIIQNKEKFIAHIRQKFNHPEKEDENVYQISTEPIKYVKVKLVKNENSTMGVVSDVTQEILEKNKIKMERDYDPLTMIYNRKAVQRRIENLIESAGSQDTAALIMFDLDYLKKINDTYGHQWGDSYINRAVSHLSKIGGTSSILGRRSGDEFVLFLFGFENRNAIRMEMDNFYQGLTKDLLAFPDSSLKPITISGGLLWIEDWTLKYDDLLNKADQILYEAKSRNKGYYVESA